MRDFARRLRFIAALSIVMAGGAAATAAPPDVVWTFAGMREGRFSQDGTLFVALGNASAGGRLEVRDVGSGALLTGVTNDISFTAVAISSNNRLIAGTTSRLTSTRRSATMTRIVNIYRVLHGVLVRTIVTDADGDITSIDFSPDSTLIATMDRLSYGSGGRTRIHNVGTGALVRLLKAGSSSTAVRFSPNGQHLALNDSNILTNGVIGGVRVVRVSDWTLAMTTGNGSRLVAWSGGGAAIWTKNNWDGSDAHAQEAVVPTGAVAHAVVTRDYANVRDVSPDDRRLIADSGASPQDVIAWIAVSDGSVPVAYQFDRHAFVSEISPDGSLFAFALVGTDGRSEIVIARTP